MTTILIKSFNRPWCLERCLNSISNVKNAGRVVVVDDGTDEKYLSVISKRFPNVIIEKDIRNKGKVEYIRKNPSLGAVGLWNGVDPNKNWVNIARKYRSDYIFIHEDDVYTPKPFDIQQLADAMRKHKVAYLDISGSFGRACRFDKIIKKHDLITTYKNTRPWSWFAAAFCIYKFELFEHLYGKGLEGLLQNGHVLRKNASNWYRFNNYVGAFANGDAKVMISDTLPSRDPYRGMRGVQRMNDALSDAWLNDQFPWRQHYPNMVPCDEIVKIFRKYNIPDKDVNDYKKWRAGRFKEYCFPYGLDGKVRWDNT